MVSRGSCFAALIANTWSAPVTLQVDYGGQALDVAALARTPVGAGTSLTYAPLSGGQLDPGDVAVLFLAQGPQGLPIAFAPCPAGITPGMAVDTSISGTALGTAFHITTSAPVVAYDIYPYGGALSYIASATLLIPTAAWGLNYIAADGWAEDPSVGDPPFLQIIASQDATSVTISPTAAVVGGTGVAPTAAGVPQVYTLAKGQVLQLEQDAELAGSPIASDKPVSVWGGASCMNIPVGVYACDSAHQELLPVTSLGHEYVGARYRDRIAGTAESPPWTIVGAVDGTTLTYDPAPPSGAPLTLASRQVVSFDADAPFTVSSQDGKHPFYLAGHMTGHEMFPNNSLGDAETVNVVPPAQYLDSYLFLTDPTYANTHLVFVRRKASDSTFKDVTLDCAGVLTGWTPVGTGGQYEVTRIDLVTAGAPNGTCNNGAHSATSAEPFGLTVWGWDTAVSYAFPAGMSTLPINTVQVPPTAQ
jgi:IgGFc binding protein